MIVTTMLSAINSFAVACAEPAPVAPHAGHHRS
jgi:hypothetical protein